MLNVRVYLLILAMLGYAVVIPAPAFAQDTNPSDCTLPFAFKVKVKNPFTEVEEMKTIPPGTVNVPVIANKAAKRGEWNPPSVKGNWDDCVTSKKTELEHRNTTGVSYPVKITFKYIKGKETKDVVVDVTAADVDKYWDEDYYKVGVAEGGPNNGTFTRAATSDFTTNCYGYATGYTTNWHLSPGAFAQIMTDDGWEKKAECCKGGIIKLAGDHAIKIDDCCPGGSKGAGKIKATSERNGTSGRYTATWDCDKGGGTIAGQIWCKK